jgi:hypothetical protein
MFTDIPLLSSTHLRHDELLAEAEQYRLGRLARDARRATRVTARAVDRAAAGARPRGVPPERTAAESPRDRRSLVPR